MIHKLPLLLVLGWISGASAQSLSDTVLPVETPTPPLDVPKPVDLVLGSTPVAGWWAAMGADSLPYDSLQRISINLGVTPGSDANGRNPRKVANALSLSIVSAEAGAIHGLQGSGAMNDVEGSVRGVQFTGGLNLVGGNMLGVQGSGVNLVRGNVTGVQYGALFNKVGGAVEGIQFGVVGNVTEGEVRGVQLASVVNRAQSVRGVQNGLLNLADRSRGVQSGLVNHTRNVKGVQLGLINIADTMVGPQIGLINIRPDSKVHVEAWTDETGLNHLGLNYGSPGWYNLIDLARNRRNRVAIGGAFGGRLPSEHLLLSLDFGAQLVVDPDRLDRGDYGDHEKMSSDQWDAINGIFRARATVGWRIWKHFAIFAGTSWNTLVVPEDGHGEHLLRPYESYHWDADDHVRMWPGLFAGIRI